MTAAHAFEFEVPEHMPAPVEAIERAEHGNVVYLTRHGQRAAAVIPPAQAEPDEMVIDVAVKALIEIIELDPDRARIILRNVLEQAGEPVNDVQRRFREEVEDLLDRPLRQRITAAIDSLAADPRPAWPSRSNPLPYPPDRADRHPGSATGWPLPLLRLLR
ncbi:MAG TPA: hypothetical protein VFX60_02490 [Micromonospora sp.]|nr:hypothetical protein [Micromonospora sp.]